MMKKLAVYLDTSIINFLFADDAPAQRDITREFFSDIVRNRVYNIYISSFVVDEIKRTPDPVHRQRLLNVITEYEIEIVNAANFHDEVVALADKYAEFHVVPENKYEDALHVALCTIINIDVLLSWNFRHLSNINKERKFNLINLQEGYSKPLRITTPFEVASYES